jgi:hypothetical protein
VPGDGSLEFLAAFAGLGPGAEKAGKALLLDILLEPLKLAYFLNCRLIFST